MKKVKKRIRRKKPEMVFVESGLKGFTEDLKNQISQINSGYRKQIDWGQSITLGLLIGLIAVIFP